MYTYSRQDSGAPKGRSETTVYTILYYLLYYILLTIYYILYTIYSSNDMEGVNIV